MSKEKSVLDLHFYCQDLGKQTTIREYSKQLLCAVWQEGEGFSGKRPFGNSGWDFEVFAVLIKNGYVRGILDEDGCVEEVDPNAAAKVITDAIMKEF